MGSALLDFALKQYEQATRLVSMGEAIDIWLEKQEGCIEGKQASRRRSLRRQKHKQEVNRRIP